MPNCGRSKKISKMNSVQDCPVTLEDYKLAEAIYGPDKLSLKES